MIYSTQTCPYCKTILKTDKNPSLEIGNPFEKCRNCHQIVINRYRKEWVTIKPSKRAMMKACRLFNKQEFYDSIELSLRRTNVIEYVEQLKKAGFEIYPIDGFDVATVHDDAVKYSLTNYYYPKDNGVRIKRQELPEIREFTPNGYDSTVNFLNTVETTELGWLTHKDRVYYAYRSFKISLSEALFPDGIIYADFIINEFAKKMKLNLEKCKCDDYFYILVIYYEIMCETILGHSKKEIAFDMMKKFPNVFTDDSVLEDLLSILN